MDQELEIWNYWWSRDWRSGAIGEAGAGDLGVGDLKLLVDHELNILSY